MADECTDIATIEEPSLFATIKMKALKCITLGGPTIIMIMHA